MKSKQLPIILFFGTLMAILAITLEYFEYRYLIGQLSQKFYISLIAIVFTLVGTWVGVSIVQRKLNPDEKNVNRPSYNIKELNLNTREYEVLALISKGNTNQEIANKLFIALPTVKTHASNLYSKLDVKNRTQAVAKARTLGIIE